MSEAFAADLPVETPMVTVRPDPNDPNRGVTDPVRTGNRVRVGSPGGVSPMDAMAEMDRRAAEGKLSPRAVEALAELKRRKGLQAPPADQAESAPAGPPQYDGGDRFVGVAATGFNKGLALPVDLINEGLKAIGLPMSDEPFMGSKFVDKYLSGADFQPQNAFESVLQRVGLEVGANTLPLAGAVTVKAANAGKEIVRAGQEATAMLGRDPGAMEQKLRAVKAIPAAMVEQLQQTSVEKLVAVEEALAAGAGFGAGGGGGGWGGGVMQSIFPEGGPTAEFIGEVVGAFTPSVAMGLVRKAIDGIHGAGKAILGTETEREAKKRLGGKLSATATPEQIQEGVDRAAALRQEVSPGAEPGEGLHLSAGESIDGSVQATQVAQQKASPGLDAKLNTQRRQNVEAVTDYFRGTAPAGNPTAYAETLQTMRQTNDALLDVGVARTQAKLDAVRGNISKRSAALLNDLESRMWAADQRIAQRIKAIGPQLSEKQRGELIRGEYLDEVGKFRERSRADYAELDNLGHAELPIAGTVSKLGALEDQFPAQLQAIRKVNPRVASVIDRLGHDYELIQRVEKAQVDLNAAGTPGAGSYPLMRFLKSRGGVHDQGGEIQNMLDKTKYNPTGLPGFRATKDRGMSLDQAAEAAFDAGKIKERSIQTLLDSISLEASGHGTMFPSWYQGLTTGKNPIEHATIVKALDAIKTGNAHDLQKDTIDHVKRAIMADSEFRKSPWFEPVMDELMNAPSASLKDLWQVRSDLLGLSRQARAADDRVQNYVLQELLGAVDSDIDALLPGASKYADLYPEHGTLYRQVSADYRAGVETLLKGTANKLRRVNKYGDYTQDDESIPALFWKNETTLQHFEKAFETTAMAKIALRDYALDQYTRQVVKSDQGRLYIDPAAHQKWMEQHGPQLKAFPDLEKTFTNTAKMQEQVDALREQAKAFRGGKAGEEALRRRTEAMRRPGDFTQADVSAAEARLKHVQNVVDRTRHQWEASKASLFLSQPADKVGYKIATSSDPIGEYEQAIKLVKGDKDAVAGLNKAIWEGLTEKIQPRLTGVTGETNLGVLHKEMQQWIEGNGALMERVLGPEGFKRIQTASEVIERIARGKKTGSDTAVALNVQAALASTWLSRGWAVATGRVPAGFGIAERRLQKLIKTWETMSATQQEAILLESFFDPKVFQTLVNAAQYGPENALVKRQLAQHLHLLNLSEQAQKEPSK